MADKKQDVSKTQYFTKPVIPYATRPIQPYQNDSYVAAYDYAHSEREIDQFYRQRMADVVFDLDRHL